MNIATKMLLDRSESLEACFVCDNKRCRRPVTKTYRTYWLKKNKDICEVCYFKEKLNRCKIGLMSIDEYKQRPIV